MTMVMMRRADGAEGVPWLDRWGEWEPLDGDPLYDGIVRYPDGSVVAACEDEVTFAGEGCVPLLDRSMLTAEPDRGDLSFVNDRG